MLVAKQTLLGSVSIIQFAPLRTIVPTFLNGNRYFRSIPTLDVCRAHITRKHKLPHNSQQIVRDPGHVFHASVIHRYKDVIAGDYDPREEGLWIVCTSNTMQGPKIVRSWARRRMSQALLGELKSRGFDKRGKRLAMETDQRAKTGAEEKDLPEMLIGTAIVETVPKIVETKYTEVQRQAGLVVEEILRICGVRPGRCSMSRLATGQFNR